MATYVSKVWKDLQAEYPTRYTLLKADQSQEVVTIQNNFGTITESGDVFDKQTMEDLEGRINAGFQSVEEITAGTVDPTGGKNGDIYFKTETEGGTTTIIGMFVKIGGSWLEVDIGGGGGDASVYIGTTPPDASVGSNGNLYVQYHLENNVPVVDAFFVKIAGAWASISTGGGGDSYIELTQAEYDALTPAEKNNGTIYFITDTNGDGEDFQPVIYSLEEREIGVWTDGKPMYERTHHIIPSSPIQPQTETTLNLPDMTDVDKYFYVDVIGGYKGAESYVANWSQFTFEQNRNDASAVCVRQNTSSSLVVWTGSNSGNFPQVSTDNRICEFYITIRYTKTTDAAGSGTWTPQGVPALHYSEDEHVIGTWIDGSTLYEKTFYRALPTSGGTQNVSFAHGISNLNIIVERSISNFIRTGEAVGTDGTSQYYTNIQSIDGTNITYKTTVDGAGRYVIITIRYTKTA